MSLVKDSDNEFNKEVTDFIFAWYYHILLLCYVVNVASIYLIKELHLISLFFYFHFLCSSSLFSFFKIVFDVWVNIIENRDFVP